MGRCNVAVLKLNWYILMIVMTIVTIVTNKVTTKTNDDLKRKQSEDKLTTQVTTVKFF